MNVTFRTVALVVLLASCAALANDDEPRSVSGISILGNQEAPKSLVIVPWKGSEIGLEPGFASDLFDDAARPVDKEVFLRELDYFDIRSIRQGEL
jgi:hypothetical protein